MQSKLELQKNENFIKLIDVIEHKNLILQSIEHKEVSIHEWNAFVKDSQNTNQKLRKIATLFSQEVSENYTNLVKDLKSDFNVHNVQDANKLILESYKNYSINLENRSKCTKECSRSNEVCKFDALSDYIFTVGGSAAIGGIFTGPAGIIPGGGVGLVGGGIVYALDRLHCAYDNAICKKDCDGK